MFGAFHWLENFGYGTPTVSNLSFKDLRYLP